MTVNILHNKLLQILIILVGVALIVNLSRDIIRLLHSADEIKQAAQRVEELEKEKESLTQKNEYYQSESFVEEEARDKLNMAKEGETIVILPPNIKEILGTSSSQLVEPPPNWRQWLNLFL